MTAPVLVLGVLARDEERSIERMLASVLRQSCWRATPSDRRQIVVYVNGSIDATAERARALAREVPEIEVVETVAEGKSQSWNELRGHLRRDADWWVFADADVILHWRALEVMFAAARDHPEAVVIASTPVASARFVPLEYRGCIDTALAESERLKPPRRMVSARCYAIRSETADGLQLPPGLLNEDLYLTRRIGSSRIWRASSARVFAREPHRLSDIIRYQVRTRLGSFQAKHVTGPDVDSNKTVAAMAGRLNRYRGLSWKAKLGKVAWVPLKLYVEWRARRTPLDALGETFWLKIGTAKLEARGARGKR